MHDQAARKCEPVRVVHVVPNLCTGGMERLVLELLKHSDCRRVVPRVLCIGERGEFAAEAEELRVPVEALHIPIRRNPGLPFRLAHFFQSVCADVIHTHGPYAHFYGSVAASISGGCRVVHTMHGFPWPRTWRRHLLSRLSQTLTQYVVAVSDDLANYARQVLKVRPDRLRIIHNAIDADRFSVSADEIQRDTFSAIMVARLSSEKDFASLFMAVHTILQRRRDFRLGIAGEGPLRRNLESSISQMGLQQHVQLLGNRSDIPALLSGARVFVLSTHTEGISIALLEAMACGLPVVATAVGGNPEVVLDGETGFLVPREAPEALASRLLWLLANPYEARRMGAAGRWRVENQFHVRRMAKSYDDLYWESAGRESDGRLLSNHLKGAALGA